MRNLLLSTALAAASLFVCGAASASMETTLDSFNGANGGNSLNSLINVNGVFYGTSTNGGANGAGTIFSLVPGGTITVLHDFGSGSDGTFPRAGLVYFKGSLYGTTSEGGAGTGCSYFGSCGTVFQMRIGGTESVLYNFQGGTDGSNPFGGLTVVGTKLYGTTLLGGSATCSSTYPSCGTIFSLTVNGVHQVKHNFPAGQHGANPASTMVYNGGKLYGTTGKGGGSCSVSPLGCGTLFRATTGGAETTLHKFTGGTDGAFPYGVTIVGSQLYGTTFYGGPATVGTLYTIGTTTAPYAVMHAFTGGADGAHPYGALTSLNGKLYGIATDGGTAGCTYFYNNPGCGTVFEEALGGGAPTVDWYFGGGTGDGGNPLNNSGMIAVGSDLFGTTYDSGAFGLGTVFDFTP